MNKTLWLAEQNPDCCAGSSSAEELVLMVSVQ